MSVSLDKIVALAKRRGFIYPGSEIYGGLSGTWDYGPLGVELKRNIKEAWWKDMVYGRDDVVGVDAAIIMNPEVWKASGHLDAFTDPLIECKNCHSRFREDSIREVQQKIFAKATKGSKVQSLALSKKEKSLAIAGSGVCPKCGHKEFTEPKTFNLLTEVFLGVTEPKQKAYLRGEITQGVFVNFANVVNSTRIKIPFGIAQIGKAFRNEITPGNFTFRSREFEQMELEFFIKPDEAEGQRWFEYWKQERMKWYTKLGINPKHLRFRDHRPDERAHYARAATDIEYEAPFSTTGRSASGGGWSEFEGIHHRGDWDLSRHRLTYKEEETGEEYTPWVIETSGGVDRATLFFLIDSYTAVKDRILLKLHPRLAPVKVAVFPLLRNKPDLVTKARAVYQLLKSAVVTMWDDRGNIGKRYYAQDEIGTPWCVTIDFQTLSDDTVTVRERDTAKQIRVSIAKLVTYFEEHRHSERRDV